MAKVKAMETENNLLGCFISGPAVKWEDDQKTKDGATEKGRLFSSYIWGTDGISNILKNLNHQDYGKDLIRILLQFYLNPIPCELANLKEIESYRKKEKSIGIPIIVNENNFFNKSVTERRRFLRSSIFKKLCLLEDVVKKKKLDTDIGKLKIDLERILKD